jgi:hypothetical protein
MHRRHAYTLTQKRQMLSDGVFAGCHVCNVRQTAAACVHNVCSAAVALQCLAGHMLPSTHAGVADWSTLCRCTVFDTDGANTAQRQLHDSLTEVVPASKPCHAGRVMLALIRSSNMHEQRHVNIHQTQDE